MAIVTEREFPNANPLCAAVFRPIESDHTFFASNYQQTREGFPEVYGKSAEELFARGHLQLPTSCSRGCPH